MTRDHFAHKAGSYESNPGRVGNVDNIAAAILDAVALRPSMHLLDFGSGTGLLLERLAPRVSKITAVDISPSMNAQLAAKRAGLPCELEILEIDLETTDIDGKLRGSFDGIVSSMTLHHIRDVEALFDSFFALLKPGGFIAIADLDREDGSFHSDGETGVHHAGFERERIESAARGAGFRQAETRTASTIRKPRGEYPVFLLTALRPA